MAKCLKEIGASKCQLLPFHQFGENKYSQLGKAYAYQDIPALHPEDLQEYKETFVKNGIEAYF
jgi:pyruvate formate lyase activating enzyme